MNLRFIRLSRIENRLFQSLVILVLLGSCNGEEHAQKKKTDPATAETPVTQVFSLKKGRLSSSLKIPGELIAYQQVDLYAKENSFVKKLFVDIGSEVKEGELLVTLEAPELGSQLAGAQAAVRSREAIYLASNANYDRLLETSKTAGTISPSDLEQAAARKNSDFAQFEAAKDAYKQVSEMQSYLQIRAPFSGMITARNINPGAYVGPSGKGSDLPLFILQEQKRLRLVISVPEAYTGFLNQKNEVSFSVRSQPDREFKAVIKRLSGSIDNRLRSQRVEMDVINNDKKLLPGMVAEVNLPLPSQDSTFVVPKSAVVNSTESVFVIRVNKKPVSTGGCKNGPGCEWVY